MMLGSPGPYAVVETSPLRLSTAQMLAVASAVIALLVLSVLVAGPFLSYAVLVLMMVGFAIIRNPVLSVLSYVVINTVLTLRPKEYGGGGAAPSVLDFMLGLCLAGVMAYWIVRIRIVEQQPLSRSREQLYMMLFAVWGLIGTGIGFLTGGNNLFNSAIRELLNFTPLLILPIIYERYIETDSSEEHVLMWAVVVAGCLMLVWNALTMRSNILRAAYLYQTGRATTDQELSGFLTLIAVSFLMSLRRSRWLIPFAIVFLAGCFSIVISMFRGLYIATAISMVCMLFSGDRAERRRGISRIGLAVGSGVLLLIPIIESSRLFRLLLMGFANRMLSTQHLGTDLSLFNRYVEWRYEWNVILHAPLFGYGFGSLWRVWDALLGFHTWIGFSHSSYLFLLLKSGLVGFCLFFLAYFGFMRNGYRLLRSPRLSETSRAIVRAGIAFLLFILIDAYTSPVFDSKTDLVWVGLIWGYFLALEKSLGMRGHLIEQKPALLTAKPIT
ncbi:MAG: O-antigen ligase family protein [Bacteroidota bacterium]|nr:O-antigen ligase family protein [Bacteroidota bacterium]